MKTRITSANTPRQPNTPSQDACAAEVCGRSVVAVLADGVGAAAMGREAALKTVDQFITFYKSRPRSWTTRKALAEFTTLINRSLYNEGIARFGRAEYLSTVALVVLEGTRLHGLNVGDSRVYLRHQETWKQLSVDHCSCYPDQEHVLARAMGMEADVQPHFFEHPFAKGDIVLLCSDGLWSAFKDEELAAQIKGSVAARSLVQTAIENTKKQRLDDVSAVLLQIQETDPVNESSVFTLHIPDRLRAGERVDGFTLRQAFKTNDRIWIATRAGESYVMKFAPLQARDQEAVHSQFVRELWTATRLEAPYFVRAFVPAEQTMLYYLQEYHPVPTLKHYLLDKPLNIPETVALGRFLLEAGQFLLRFDLVHGDLKPENILVIKREDHLEFKLIDFGSIADVFSVTWRAGTPSYLAPEMFNNAPVSERTEVFAIGVTLFHALTGRFPFGEIEPFQTPRFSSAARPSSLNPLIPEWLEAVLLRALAVDPSERHQSFSEMKFELENPQKVRPFYRKDTPLLERNPVGFYRASFFVVLFINLYLLFLLFGR